MKKILLRILPAVLCAAWLFACVACAEPPEDGSFEVPEDAECDPGEAGPREGEDTVRYEDSDFVCTFAVLEDGTVRITQYCGQGAEVIIPDSLGGRKVSAIGDSAFECCDTLTSVVIPEGVTAIGDDAFGTCPSLSRVTIPEDMVSIGSGAFYACEALASISIPEGVISLAENTFYGCTRLSAVTLPGSLRAIGASAFEYCIGLRAVSIPEGTLSIGQEAFRDCRVLAAVTLPDSLRELGDGAFDGCGQAVFTVREGTYVQEVLEQRGYTCEVIPLQLRIRITPEDIAAPIRGR